VSQVNVERVLDKELLKLNDKRFPNGHTPFTALLSFTSILGAILFGFGTVAFSNERSSEEENVSYLGKRINHQYSKTLDFENKFRDYNQRYLSNINYFSFLRPLYDIQIVKIFSNFDKYFPVIRSCNVGQKTNSWCGKCPKCLSTFILLNPFLKEKNISIFGKDLLKDESLKPLLNSLISEIEVKPFECVGTREELKVALGILKDSSILSSWNADNNLPIQFREVLLFSTKKILILGMGREGKSTLKYLNKFNPKLDISTADQKDGPDYLDNLKDFDLIIKSPGIPWKLEKIQEAKKAGINFTSQTQIFLELFRDQTVGVTGTKGKSTTSSLIYQILKTAGKKVELVGNIGKPVLDYLVDQGDETIFVYEMSSHQLSDISISPHIAVLLNIYPEHLDYYISVDEYLKAKANIAKFQNESDLFVYNDGFKEFVDLANSTNAIKKPFSSQVTPESMRIKLSTNSLLGSHNQSNMVAAIIVARSFGIDDLSIKRGLESFKPLEDRLEIVGKVDGVEFVNDGLATVPQATIAAIKSFKNAKLTLILGGFDRGIDFAVLGEELSKSKNVKNIILIGQTADKIKNELGPDSGFNIYNLGFSTMDEIVKKAFEVSKPDGVVLLSPSATSFDMFKDYKDRDDHFKKAVKNLK